MRTTEAFPKRMSDVLVNSASDIFSRTEIKGVSLPADLFVGDVFNAETYELFDQAVEGQPLICLVNVSAGDDKTVVVVDRHAYVNTFNLRAKDAASLKEAIKRLTADGSIRIGNNNKEV
ncbi:TPA: hypothetical protein RGJ53_004165 [Escherichia coli]|uniref:hypothetical protein n=1 Tax=Enterobacteriaceae TaxID=543 RepID=UPI000CFBE888|nr:hypothetical protein [Cronobacter turicensis]ELQ6274877.1 hypothetical protein [Cronobacter sakazakii]HDU8034078.1 hypothetical protein [Escherichia coli]ELY4129870.1 hypothetical protein [Cronobacter turicensis]ELY4317262.1 hypothetical protein [Cronobacter sakazakii]